MGIFHLQNSNHGYAFPIESSVRFGWQGFVSGLKDQSIWMFYINGELAFSVSMEFMASCCG